jgi:hypothetical protein
VATPGEPLTTAETCRIIARELAESALRILIRRRRRDAPVVAAEYDLGYWRRVLSERAWRRHPSLEDFLNPGNADVRVVKLDNRYTRLRTDAYYDYRRQALCGIMQRYAAEADELVELGCGFGRNIFTLTTADPVRRFVGLDVSPHAIAAAAEIAAHFCVNGRATFDVLDLANRADPNWSYLRGRTVFTYYCLEQLKYSMPQVIDNITTAAPRRVIHVEPCVERLRLWSPKDLVNYLYIVRQDYQDSLLTTVRHRERSGTLRILGEERLYYAPTIRHDPTLICWEPRSTTQDAGRSSPSLEA